MGHKIEGQSEQVCIRLPVEIVRQAESIAERLKTPRADVLRQSIEIGIPSLAKQKPVAAAKEAPKAKRSKAPSKEKGVKAAKGGKKKVAKKKGGKG